MYKTGDYIHQASNGLCMVEEVSTLDFDGVDRNALYYRLSPVGKAGSTVFIPVEKSDKTTRYAMTMEEAEALIEDMPSVETLWIPEERARERLYKEALLSMDYHNWVKIIKTVYVRKLSRQARGQKVTSRDEEYLRKAEERLYAELAHALGRNKENMEAYILEKIEGSMEKI